VHLTYEVEVGDAIEMKELPFVLGVLGDFSGKPDVPLPKLKDRKLIEIDRDNFDKVLAGMKPRLAYRVDNKLTDEGGKLNVELRFNSLADFEPDNVVRQVEPLRKLIDARRRLSELLSKMDGNDRLEELLQDVLANTDNARRIGAALGLDTPAPAGAAKEEVNE
jgi:type VI secretion system protein ImpB